MMYPHTEAFRRALLDPSAYVTRVFSLLDPAGTATEITDYFVDGNLTVGRQEIRTSGTLTFANDDGTMLPVDDEDHPLAPYGQELLVYRGVRYGDGSEELIPQTPLRITAVGSPDGGQTVVVRVFDRMWRVKRNKLEKPFTIAKGTLVTTAIEDLLRRAWPGIGEFETVPTGEVTPVVVLDASADPATEATKLATSLGYELYFDRDGTPQLHPLFDTTDSPPVWTYDDGSTSEFLPQTAEAWSNLGLSTVGIDWDTEDTFNVWIVRGENSTNDTPFVGTWRHTSAGSPLRYGGRFGNAVSFTSDPNVTSTSMATASARAKALEELGVSEGVSIPAMLNPAIALSDPILIVRARLGLNQVHLVDQYTVPLRSASQAIGTRRRRVVELGD